MNNPTSSLINKIEFIKKTVEDYFGMKMDSSNNNIRKGELIQMRQIATYLSRKHTKAFESLIGRMIGDKKVPNVVWSIKACQNHIDTDKHYRADIEALDIIINNYKEASKEEVTTTPSKQNAELRLYQMTQTFSRRARHYYNSK